MKPDVSLRWIAERTPGYVAADLASLVQTSAYNAAKHSVVSVQEYSIHGIFARSWFVVLKHKITHLCIGLSTVR